MKQVRQFLLFLVTALLSTQAVSHHVLGRPAYSLNEDSNTPPSMNIETQIGNYFVTAMVFPAFPRPHEAGRIHFYATHLDSGEPLNTDVTFRVKDNSWFSSHEEKLGAQVLEDNVYRQGFIFQQQGDYIITAEFVADDKPYTVEFPMSVGNPLPVGPLGIAVGVIVLTLITVSVVQRKRLTRARIQSARPSKSTIPE